MEREIYYLNGKEYRTIPVPHDCVINKVELVDDCLVFCFEEDISIHDSIKCQKPKAKSLTIKFHFAYDVTDISMCISKKPKRKDNYLRVFEEIEAEKIVKKLGKLAKKHLEYLYHYVAYNSIILKLWARKEVVVEINADYIEFLWGE